MRYPTKNIRFAHVFSGMTEKLFFPFALRLEFGIWNLRFLAILIGYWILIIVY